jgi:hypothetical protein
MGSIGEVAGELLAQIVADEHAPRAIALRLVFGQVNNIDCPSIDPANVTDHECSDFPDTHSGMNAESKRQLVARSMRPTFSHAHHALDLVLREYLCLCQFPAPD